MIYISLPNFYQNMKFYNFFKVYLINNKEKLVTNCVIDYCYGSFPWCYWNGGHNNHLGKAILSPEMNYIIDCSTNRIRLDCSNLCLKDKDFYDVHQNAALQVLFNTGGICEISNLSLQKYIQSKNPYMKFALSNNYWLVNNFTQTEFDKLYQDESIELINLDNTKSITLLDRKKIELNINSCIFCDSSKKDQCILLEQKNIYNYSDNTSYLNCKNSKMILNYWERIKPLYQEGFSHFKINFNGLSLEQFNSIIIQSFIKPEYIGECLLEYQKFCWE